MLYTMALGCGGAARSAADATRSRDGEMLVCCCPSIRLTAVIASDRYGVMLSRSSAGRMYTGISASRRLWRVQATVVSSYGKGQRVGHITSASCSLNATGHSTSAKKPSTPPTDEAAQLARRCGRRGELAPSGALAARHAQLAPAQALAEILDVAQNRQCHVDRLLQHLHSQRNVLTCRFH